jgi:formylglycine-generating enzyme required for sulfatase activity
MGSPNRERGRGSGEAPEHTVAIAQPFAAGKFEVTVDQFAAFVRESGFDAGSRCWTLEDGKLEERGDRSWRNPGYSQNGTHPAACISWHDAKAYAAWLSRKAGKSYRLLTEGLSMRFETSLFARPKNTLRPSSTDCFPTLAFYVRCFR